MTAARVQERLGSNTQLDTIDQPTYTHADVG
jgi:hypothetical protein